MKKYVKKPVVIEALQITGDNWGEIYKLTETEKNVIIVGMPNEELGVDIVTLEGVMRGNVGDWIIKGVGGEIYPCKPHIFDMTYGESE